jgi:DNA recombination protein RmuC
MALDDFIYGFIVGAIVFVPLVFAVSYKIFENMNMKSERSARSIALEIIRETGMENENVSKLLAQNVSSSTETILEKKQAEINSVIKPLTDSLTQFQKKVEEIEKSRIEDTTSIRDLLREMAVANQRVSDEAQHLNNILRNSVNRGRWGELTLRRIVEITGLKPRIDFEEQVFLSNEARPDMVVHLPGNREIIIDSKAPYKKYLEYMESDNEGLSKKLIKEYADDIREHIRNLGSKKYTSQLRGSADFVVMFLPEESMISAAIAGDPNIFEYGISQNVIVSTPMTLIGLLRIVNLGWQERTIMENSENILILAKELHERLRLLMDKIGNLGKSIDNAMKNYNGMISTFESRVIPSIRKLEDMGSMKQIKIEMKPFDEIETMKEDRWA